MDEIIEHPLPSGAVLRITHTPYEDSWGLFEVCMDQLKEVQFSSDTPVMLLYKDLFCSSVSSAKIKTALWKCLARCTYDSGTGNKKIDKQTFEPQEARQDYLTVCLKVGEYNLLPFVKAHFAEFSQVLGIFQDSPKSKPSQSPS